MSDRCEPPEELRGRVGHHALEQTHIPYPMYAWWNPQFEGWRLQGMRGANGWTSPREAWLRGLRYLCSIPTPSDLAAAKEREAVLVEALRDARRFVQAELDVRADSFCAKGPDGKPDWSTLDESDGGACGEALDYLARIDTALKETAP